MFFKNGTYGFLVYATIAKFKCNILLEIVTIFLSTTYLSFSVSL